MNWKEFSRTILAENGRFIDRVLIPLLSVFTVGIALHRISLGAINVIIIIRSIIIPITVLMLIWTSKVPKKSKVGTIAFIGLLLSFGAFYLFEGNSAAAPLSLLFSIASTLFYMGIAVWSYISLGTNFGIIPALRQIQTRGAYKLVRHPIYSCYIHLAITYFTLMPSVRNAIAALLVTIGLFLRSIEEEKLLLEDPVYLDFAKSQKSRFISIPFSMPLILSIIASVFSMATTTSRSNAVTRATVEPDIIQLAFPITSLDPIVYDDWSSVFIGNHIYLRFLPEPERPGIQAIAQNFAVTCANGQPLIEKCDKIEIRFNVEPFKDCMGRDYGAADVRSEIEKILQAKTWVLPGYKFCPSSGTEACIQARNVPDLKRRLRNLYFRFGWSKAEPDDNLFGSGPYCLKVDTKSKNEIRNAQLLARSKSFAYKDMTIRTSIDPKDRFSVAIYGTTELLRGSRVNVATHTPLGYYLVSNPGNKTHSYPWNSTRIKSLIRAHFVNNEVIYPDGSELEHLLPTGNALIDTAPSELRPAKSFELLLPEYVPKCDELKNALNEEFSRSHSRAEAKCINTSELSEKITKHGYTKWDGFLTPLSPGAPGKNSIKYQYFSSDSKEAWTGKEQDAQNYFYLVGIGQSFVTLDNMTICGLKPNSMGLGDVFVSDFIRCPQQ